MRRTLFTSDHDLFRQSFRRFCEKEIVPYNDAWHRDGIVARDLWTRAGQLGFLALDAPEEYGGADIADYAYGAIITEEIVRVNAMSLAVGLSVHNDIVLPYLLRYGNVEQKKRWLPGICAGEKILAIAMTEPDTGSDLAAIRTSALRKGDRYILNGTKTFITNGILADLVVVAAKTDTTAGRRGISLLVVERGMAGFERGRKLDKIGLAAQDTAELVFENVAVPTANLLGDEGLGFTYLTSMLPRERLAVAVMAVAASETALALTVEYCKERRAFGQPIGSFQNSRFRLAEMATEVEVARVFVDRCIEALRAGELSPETAAMAKWWTTEVQGRVVDQCVQLHGGYGYMTEYPIARLFLDARAQRIYAGTNEIMKEIIGRSMGLA